MNWPTGQEMTAAQCVMRIGAREIATILERM
jgi:hypothetical protein